MIVLSWIVLVVLLGVEIAAALFHAGWITAVVAPLMIAIVVTAFMKIRSESSQSRIFAMAGLFWLAIMLSLGSLDFIVRRNVPAPQTTSSADYR